MDKASASGAEDCGFESHQGRTRHFFSLSFAKKLGFFVHSFAYFIFSKNTIFGVFPTLRGIAKFQYSDIKNTCTGMLLIHNKICALYMDLFYDTSPDKVLNVSVCFYSKSVIFKHLTRYRRGNAVWFPSCNISLILKEEVTTTDLFCVYALKFVFSKPSLNLLYIC